MPDDAIPAKKSSLSVAPKAIDTIRSYRGWGYDLGTALADLIDNSITANAATVRIKFNWSGVASTVSLFDDGDGMSPERLAAAMAMGANPADLRDPNDLGRFGLGLKTSSWSQCVCLTVCSKSRGHDQAVARWDAEHVEEFGDWDLLLHARPGSEHLLDAMAGQEHGTVVIWEGLHDLSETEGATDQRFWERVGQAERHLGMVFHRYIEQRRLSITINDRQVAPFDPMLSGNMNRVATPEEILWLGDQAIRFSGFVMPLLNTLNPTEYDAAGGPYGWLEAQGFYVYRLDRIVIAGGWLGLGKAGKPWPVDPAHTLARISLDIPNSMDTAWRLTVRKHGATPPEQIRDRLLKLAQTVRRRAKAIAAGYRATSRPKPIPASPWAVSGTGAALQFSINRKTDAVVAAIENANDGGKAVRALLDLIDKTAPMQPVGLPAEQKADEASAPGVSPDETLIKLVALIWYTQCVPKGASEQELRVKLSAVPQLQGKQDLIERGIERIKEMAGQA